MKAAGLWDWILGDTRGQGFPGVQRKETGNNGGNMNCGSGHGRREEKVHI